ncbi:MAG: hypothetical protein JWN10_1048, partial [Solirubrobacterales bacterium]|nr:hypothetical protein [Solirubrobacterales bacterium]
MTPRSILRGRPRRLAAAVLAIAFGSLVLALLVGAPGATSRAGAQVGGEEAGEVTPQTDAAVPATHVTMIGSAPKEATDETWGLGLNRAGESVLVRYTPETGWTLGPALLDSSGQPLSGFKLDQPEAFRFNSPSPLAGTMTENGSSALAGEVPAAKPSETKTTPVLLVRDPGGAFQETMPVPSTGEAALQKGERLFGVNRAPIAAALEEASGKAGALVAPVTEGSEGAEDRVLHWNGEAWSSEPIEVPAESKGEFDVLAIAASSPENAWLLARLSSKHYPTGSVVLFRRRVGTGGEPTTWQLVAPTATGEPVPLEVPTLNKE